MSVNYNLFFNFANINITDESINIPECMRTKNTKTFGVYSSIKFAFETSRIPAVGLRKKKLEIVL